MYIESYLTLSDSAKKYWRNFAPVWLVPIWYLLGMLVLRGVITQDGVMFLTGALFCWAMVHARSAAYGPDIRKSHIDFLSIFGPFIAWVLLLAGFFVLWMMSLAF